MPGLELGTGALQTAGSTALGIQELQQKKAEENQKAIQASEKPIQDMALQKQQSDLDQVTITPQIAAGLKKTTGDDSWDRAVGTKWKSNVFTAIVTSQAQSKYHNDLLNNKDLLEQMKDAAAQRKQDAEDKAKADRQASEDAAKKDREKTGEEAKAKREKDKATRAASTKASTKDLQAQKALLAEEHNKQAVLTNPFADDKSKSEAQKWLDDNSDALKQAENNMKISAGVKTTPAPSGPAASSGTAATVPLDQKLPGLD